MMIEFLATADKPSRLMGLFGNLHPAIVHFPLALLTTAALLEAWQILRKKPGPAPGVVPMVLFAALSAPVACVFGLCLAEMQKAEGTYLDLHKWLGIASAVVSVVAGGAALKSASCPVSLNILRGALFLGAALVGATGYLGGEMTLGTDHLLKWFRSEEKPKETQAPGLDPDTSRPTSPGHADVQPSPAGSGKVNFETQIAPIMKASCLKCHNPGKKKGKLLLDTKANAMKGGENGPILVPGKPQESSFYKLLIDPDPDVRMPEKEKALPKDQIELIKTWIEQGAPWPDGLILK